MKGIGVPFLYKFEVKINLTQENPGSIQYENCIPFLLPLSLYTVIQKVVEILGANN